MIFSWINNTRFPFFGSDDYLGIKTKVHKLGTELYGIDPRILEISDDKFLVVYSLFGKHVGKGCIVFAGYEKNLSSDSMEFYLTPKKVFLDTDRNSRQKNWMPFLFNNTPHFVQRHAILYCMSVLYCLRTIVIIITMHCLSNNNLTNYPYMNIHVCTQAESTRCK